MREKGRANERERGSTYIISRCDRKGILYRPCNVVELPNDDLHDPHGGRWEGQG